MPLNSIGKKGHWVILRLLALPAGLGFILYLFGSERALQALEFGNWYLLFGLCVSQLANFLVAVRLRWVLAIVDVRLTVLASYRLYLQSMYYYFFLPGGAGSEVSKYMKLRGMSPHSSPYQLVNAIIVDRVIGFSALTTLAVLTIVFANPIGYELDLVWVVAVGGGILLLFAAVVLYVPRFKSLALRCFVTVRDNGRVIFASYLLSISLQIVLAVAVFLGAIAWGIVLSFIEVVFGISASFLFQIIPLTIAGAGGAEAAGIPIYMAIGLAATDAVLIVSTIYSYRLATAMIGGIWELLATRDLTRS